MREPDGYVTLTSGSEPGLPIWGTYDQTPTRSSVKKHRVPVYIDTPPAETSEPVAWMVTDANGVMASGGMFRDREKAQQCVRDYWKDPNLKVVPLYAAPPEDVTKKLREALKNVADELESEVEHLYRHTKSHPAMKDRYDRDMESVIAARTVLGDREQ